MGRVPRSALQEGYPGCHGVDYGLFVYSLRGPVAYIIFGINRVRTRARGMRQPMLAVEYCLIGSANLDPRSLRLNFEDEEPITNWLPG